MRPGLKQAINLANRSLKQVPGYGKFLRSRHAKTQVIKNENDFLSLPIMDKKNYIHNFSNFELFHGKKIPQLAYASSGSSGQPTFWFRDDKQDYLGGKLHEKIFKDIFGIKKNEPTLVIVCFSMGVWVAGSYTLSSCKWISSQGYNLTTITPGIEKADIFHILKTLAPKFKHTVLAGYPSFVMDVLAEYKLKNQPLPKKMNLLTAGDSFSEQWRQTILKILGQESRPESVISVYGSADTGAIAFETPLTIAIRQAGLKNKSLYQEMFGDAEKTPSVLQYLPEQTFIESLNGELILTTKNTIPLVRYNIHDVGRVINYQEMEAILTGHGVKLHRNLERWQLPFVLKFGRTDVAVTFYALNIYPEHIASSISDPKIANIFSGNFRAYNKVIKNHKQEQLWLELETKPSKTTSKKSVRLINRTVTANLLKLNAEFRKLHSIIGPRALPKIKLVPKLDMAPVNTRALVGLNGKKPKIIP